MLNFIKKNIEKQRKELDEWTNERNKFLKIPEDIEILQDIPYLYVGNTYNSVDIFKQKNCNRALPVIINVHGGGLVMGTKEQNKRFNLWLCKQGFLVYSIEYSLVPDVEVPEQIREVNLAMTFIKNRIEADGGDMNNVFMVGDSAGAFLITYCMAAQKSKQLAKAFSISPSGLNIKAIALQSGMFYTTKFDKIGLFLSNTLYGKGYKKQPFAKYLNPENEEIVKNLPPVHLMTSEGDNLKHYTLNFAKALKKNGAKYELLCCPKNANMTHAFSVLHPEREVSIKANKTMVEFIKKHF